MPETQSLTIKERLLADIRSGYQLPDVLARRHGLNGHDLVKNLEQLRKEGFIHLKWGAGQRVERVRPVNGQTNMRLLEGHVGEGQKLRGMYSLPVSNAIASLPWEGEWRKWDLDRVRDLTGLSNGQIMSTLVLLREQGRIQQLGGGHRGVPIRGIRWRGEHAPASPAEPRVEESAIAEPPAPPEPSGDLAERFPVITMLIQLGKELEELMNGRA